jgi:PAS domain S-box-containing protein
MPLSGTLKILIVDDDDEDFLITSDLIKRAPGIKATTDWCNKHDKALQHMTAREYDLYFVDYRLGAKSGIDLLKAAIEQRCEEPIILLTGKGSYNIDKEATESGATDYLVKSELTTEKIERCIRYAIGRSSVLKALKANERKYRNVFEKSKDVVFIADLDLNFKSVNKAIEDVLGYSKEQCVGKSLYDFIEQPQHRRYLQNILRTGRELIDWEAQLLTSDNERRHCILTVSIEENEQNDEYVQGIIHDITTLKKMEKAHLQTEKLGLTARLVHTLAHEVRNPLNNITLSVEQMAADTDDENTLTYLNIIARNSKRINSLITELLNTSRPAEITLNIQPLHTILDEVIGAAKDRITLKRIELETEYPHYLYINADKDKLVIALLNIVINAIEAMQEGEGKLSVFTEISESSVVIKIQDTGCGISEENISRLFEPYFTQKRNGVGLGLAFTLNIIQSHSGSIEVNSEQGKGTVFAITLPVGSFQK